MMNNLVHFYIGSISRGDILHGEYRVPGYSTPVDDTEIRQAVMAYMDGAQYIPEKLCQAVYEDTLMVPGVRAKAYAILHQEETKYNFMVLLLDEMKLLMQPNPVATADKFLETCQEEEDPHLFDIVKNLTNAVRTLRQRRLDQEASHYN